MACEYAPTRLVLYLDGALPPTEAHTMAAHLQSCSVCQEEATRHRRLQELLRLPLPEDEVPPRLWATLQARLAQESSGAPVAPVPSVRPARRQRWRRAGALAALAVLMVSLLLWRTAALPVVVQELVESQIRSRLMGIPYQPLPADVVAISGWFADKVAFPVLVPALPPERYTFLGARVNYFLDRRVVEMVYAAGQHTVTFVMFEDRGIRLSALSTLRLGARTLYIYVHKGFTIALWHDSGAVCGLVSDLPRTVLVEALKLAMPPTASS